MGSEQWAMGNGHNVIAPASLTNIYYGYFEWFDINMQCANGYSNSMQHTKIVLTQNSKSNIVPHIRY